MKKNAAVPLLLLLAILAPGGAASAAAQSSSAQTQADAFLDKARAALAAGSSREASDLLVPALQLAPDYSEALYLRAQVELPDQDSTPAAVSDLRAALANASWTVTDPSVARQALAEVLIRTGQLREAEKLLAGLAARNPADPRTYRLLARLYARQGSTAVLGRMLRDARARFPLDDELATDAARLSQRQGRRAEALRLISTQLEVHPDSLVLLLEQAGLEPTASARAAAVRRYDARGGKDPLADVIALEAGAADPATWLSRFVDNGGLSRQDLVERVARAVRGRGGLSSDFRRDLSEYTGNRDLDPQRDGFYAERWTFRAGQPVAWVRDPRKDGLPEYRAGFADGKPHELAVREGNTVLTITYSTYPFVASLESPAATAEGPRTWLLVPYTVRFPFLTAAGPSLPGLAPTALRNPGRPSLPAIIASSYMEEDFGPDGRTLVRRIDLLRGKRVFMEEDTLGKGTFNHRVWYENGVPVRGERDLDGSGKFAVKETWSGGRLVAIAVDTRGDGKISYRERYVPTLVKSWDYDEDGIDDSREYVAGPDTIVREFSTRRNGIFDLKYTWKKNELVSVLLHGTRVPVTHDAARGLVWIGRPAPAGVPFEAGGPEGYRILAGKPYLVFNEEGVTYAEELP